MMPFALGGTVLLVGLNLLELLSKGQIRTQDNLMEVYCAIMGAYAGAGELKGWFQKGSEPVLVQDPWLERARKGGWFVTLWVVLFAAAVLVRVSDPSYPMPRELKGITLGVIGIFFVSYSSRRLRRTRRSAAAAAVEGDSIDYAQRVMDELSKTPRGLTRRELGERLSDIPQRSLVRSLGSLLEAGRLERDGHPKSPDTRYRTA